MALSESELAELDRHVAVAASHGPLWSVAVAHEALRELVETYRLFQRHVAKPTELSDEKNLPSAVVDEGRSPRE